ncbi:MAG: NFACT RNA binding domain-containing protein, partial [Planctomycetota bacterium]
VDLHAGRARALVTDDPPPVPDEPPVLGTILRRALRGGTLLGTMLLAKDRVLGVDVRRGEESYRLVVEALPRHANLLLLDAAGTVLRVLDGEAAKRRGNPVGAIYRLPTAPAFRDEPSLLPDDLPAEPFAVNHRLDRLARETARGEGRDEAEATRGKRVARLARARDAARADLAALPDPHELRRQGESLLSRFGELRRGMEVFEGVTLDPRFNPQENVEAIFERARKAARARPALEARLRELEAAIERAEAGEAPATLAPSSRPPKPPPRLPYRTFLSADGLKILVGKGGADNDALTLRVAGPHDVFFHVRGTPGAHVIVPLGRGQPLPEQTLLDAATLALHYSRHRTAATADVTYTERRNVTKPKGAKPGLVEVRHEKVLRVRREAQRLARLLSGGGPDE